MTAAPAVAAPARRSVPPTSGLLRRSAHYFWQSLRASLLDFGFIGFILAMPTAMYLFFAKVYGADEAGGIEAKKQIMVSMGTYGAMGSALVAGNTIQMERATGWLRQLMLTALTTTQFFVVRALVALVVIIPPIALVLLVGRLDGVEMGFTTWLAVAGVALITLIPFVIMGIVVGLWLKPQAASGATTFLMLSMAMLGGMWVPLEMMPTAMQSLGKFLPSYWAAEFSKIPLDGAELSLTGILVLVGWTIGLTLLGLIGYRRAIATSKR